MKSVLIVDDDVKLGSMLREYLERHQIHLEICHNGELGLEAASRGQYDLMLLDVTLPDVDGFEVLERLRVYSNLSVMLLTARGQAADRIRGLQLGADDYLSKPFDPEELVARIHAILRRSTPGSATPSSAGVSRRLSLGQLDIDLSSRSTRYKQRPLDLTDIEFSLLETFARFAGYRAQPGRTGESASSNGPTIRLTAVSICMSPGYAEKLNGASVAGNPIKTIRSAGYLFSTSEL